MARLIAPDWCSGAISMTFGTVSSGSQSLLGYGELSANSAGSQGTVSIDQGEHSIFDYSKY